MKKRGRPKVNAKPVNVRFPPAEIKVLDAWIARQPDSRRISRPEAVRRIVATVAEPERRSA